MKKNNTCRFYLITTLVLLVSLLLASSVMAHTHWRQGTVTKIPWREHYRHIEIDNKLYTFMPEATFKSQKKNHYNKSYTRKSIPWQQIRIGNKVSIKIQGRRIYQLIITQ